MGSTDERDAANPADQGPTFELGNAIAASSQRVAVRTWQDVYWYVAWVKPLIRGQPSPRYRVACLTIDGYTGWQVRTIAQVERLLAHFWGIDPANSDEVWADWTPFEMPLEQIVGAISWQGA